MTIQEIKEKTKLTEPYFFSTDTMKFFNQTLRSFKVSLQEDKRFKISAPMKDSAGKYRGETIRYFNPINNNLERT